MRKQLSVTMEVKVNVALCLFGIAAILRIFFLNGASRRNPGASSFSVPAAS